MKRTLPWLLALAACWVDPDEYWDRSTYEEEYVAAYCKWIHGCFGPDSGWQTVDACRAYLTHNQQDHDDCDYDPDAARECVDGWLSLRCSAWSEGVSPEACADVYDCGGTR